jgi:hypothetical protein
LHCNRAGNGGEDGDDDLDNLLPGRWIDFHTFAEFLSLFNCLIAYTGFHRNHRFL